MIKGIIIVNNSGKPRLVKFYQNVFGEERQQSVIRRVFQQVSTRSDSFCNYLEGSIPEWGDNIKLIYRHYATLYFVFVEALDKQFENAINDQERMHKQSIKNATAGKSDSVDAISTKLGASRSAW
eukprot:scaffold34225_cov155-Skeletonema_dohrnii-CCMP3373.AAC.8